MLILQDIVLNNSAEIDFSAQGWDHSHSLVLFANWPGSLLTIGSFLLQS